VLHNVIEPPILVYHSSTGESGKRYVPNHCIWSCSAVTCNSSIALENCNMNIGPCSFPSSLPSNSSRFVSCIVSVVGSGWSFWIGDRGGADGSAGDCGYGESMVEDAVREVSDERLYDSEDSSVTDGMIVFALAQDIKQPFLSWKSMSVMFIMGFSHILCEATMRCFSYVKLART